MRAADSGKYGAFIGRLAFAVIAACFVPVQTAITAELSKHIERNDLESIFARAGVVGTFVLYTPTLDRMIVVNSARAARRYIPASTFKIANSLIALETGVIKDEYEIIPYGGKPQPIKSWERDMSLRDAIRISNVPVYQEVAIRIGNQQYREWLKRLGYGNSKTGLNPRTFWLEGPLAISAMEQARFLARLADKSLPMSTRAQETVANMIELQRSAGDSLYGKTGWTGTPNPDIGWFVGWVRKGETINAFALNIDIRNREDAKQRKPITMQLLQRLGQFSSK